MTSKEFHKIGLYNFLNDTMVYAIRFTHYTDIISNVEVIKGCEITFKKFESKRDSGYTKANMRNSVACMFSEAIANAIADYEVLELTTKNIDVDMITVKFVDPYYKTI